MRRLLPCLLLPLVTSCVVQESYYEPGYYPPPPPPRAEVHRYGQHSHGYRPAPQARVEQRHDNYHGGRPAVVGNSRQPQVHGQAGQYRHDEHRDARQSGSVVVEHH